MTRDRRVALIVTPRFPPLLGGMERECALLAEEFARRGLAPVVVTEQLGTDLPRDELHEGVRIHRIPSSEQRSLATQLAVAVRMALLVLRYRRRADVAIVRTMTLPSLLVGLLKRLRLLPFPTLVTAETGGAADDVVALAERPLFGLSRALVSGNDVINGICQANIDHLHEYGFPATKIAGIPNGIDTSAWSSSSPPARVRRFIFLGRIGPGKGLDELIEAFATLSRERPGVSLTIAGDGPSLPEVRARVAELGLDATVQLPGRIDYERVPSVLAQHDCMVLPSYSEGMPLSVLEAAVQRRPMVITDVGDIRALFGERIRIVAPRDAVALTDAMRAAADDPQPQADYGEVIARVGIGSVVDAMLARLDRPRR